MSELRYKCEDATTCLRCDNSIEELQERGLTSSDGSCKNDPDACQLMKIKRAKELEALQNLRGDKLPKHEPCCQFFDQCENAEENYFEYCPDCVRNWDNEEYSDYFEPKEVEVVEVKPGKKMAKDHAQLLIVSTENTRKEGEQT